MTDETARALRETLAVAARSQEEADAQKRSCVTQIADGLHERIDAIAKSAARQQPEVTKTLGREGIQKMRAELAGEAERLSADISGAADKIEWPMPQFDFSAVEPHKIHSALFNYMYGARVDRIAALLKSFGYSIRDDNAQRSQHLILPQSLYSIDNFGMYC